MSLGVPREGEVLLVEHRDIVDPDTGSGYSVKRVFLEPARRRVRLVSANPDYPTIETDLGPEDDPHVRFVARLLEVLG